MMTKKEKKQVYRSKILQCVLETSQGGVLEHWIGRSAKSIPEKGIHRISLMINMFVCLPYSISECCSKSINYRTMSVINEISTPRIL